MSAALGERTYRPPRARCRRGRGAAARYRRHRIDVGGNPAITEGNTVYTARGYSSDLSTTPVGIRTLVHEFTHVRQFQQVGFGSFADHYAHDLASAGGCHDAPYDYASWREEPIEGQAQMVGDYAMYRAGGGNLTQSQAHAVERRLAGTGIFGL